MLQHVFVAPRPRFSGRHGARGQPRTREEAKRAYTHERISALRLYSSKGNIDMHDYSDSRVEFLDSSRVKLISPLNQESNISSNPPTSIPISAPAHVNGTTIAHSSWLGPSISRTGGSLVWNSNLRAVSCWNLPS